MRMPFVVVLFCAGCLAGAAGAQTPLTTVRIASGLQFPLWAGSPPGDNRLFAVEQTQAHVHLIEQGLPVEPPFLDLGAKVLTSASEGGLLGLAFDPAWTSNGFLYVYYTRQPDGATLVERYHASSATAADPSSAVVIFGPVAKPQDNHNGGNIRFGPAGKLFIGIGDGGGAYDLGPGHVAGGNAQSGGQLLGKILRLNADGSIPPDNPFASPTDGFLGQIWDYGVRNPWRWSFDRVTGDFWLGDVGQEAWEEIDFQPASGPAAKNFGWRCMEALQCTGNDGCTCNASNLTMPIHVYGHDNGDCAVVGGFVYRGAAIPDLHGTYFFADYCSARIWSFNYYGQTVTNFKDRTAELAPGVGMSLDTIDSFGEDSAGELLIVDRGGEIFQVIQSPFTNLGGALAGSNGLPVLAGQGGLQGGQPSQFALTLAKGNAPGLLVLGATPGSVPFKGGILVPVPFHAAVNLVTDATGEFDLPLLVPPSLPSGLTFYVQCVIADAAAVKGASLSNAIKGTIP